MPAWLAVMEQVPPVRSVTMFVIETVQTFVVVEANDTVSIELEVACSANGAVPKVMLLRAAKVIVWAKPT